MFIPELLGNIATISKGSIKFSRSIKKYLNKIAAQIFFSFFFGVKYLAEHFLEQVCYLQHQNFTPKNRFFKNLEVRGRTLHRSVMCQFLPRWISYCYSSKSTRKKTSKTHLCALGQFDIRGYTLMTFTL